MSEHNHNQIIDLRRCRPGMTAEKPQRRETNGFPAVVNLRAVKTAKSQVETPDPTRSQAVPTSSSSQSPAPENSFVHAKSARTQPEPTIPQPSQSIPTEVKGINFISQAASPQSKPPELSPQPNIRSWRQSVIIKGGQLAKFFNLSSSLVWRKSLALFILACVFSVTTIRAFAFFQGDVLDKKDKILADANVAYQYMGSGGKSVIDKDYDLASYKFSVASQRFVSAQDELNILGSRTAEILSVFPGGDQVSAADNLLTAGSEIALASQDMTKALAPFAETPSLTESLTTEGNNDTADKISFTNALLMANSNLSKALTRVEKAENNLNAVSLSALPTDITEQVKEVRAMVPKINQALRQWLSYSEVMLEILGHDNPRKYLFIFQNNRELRATGGFIGTYGLFDINEGKVENIKIEGPYNIDGQLLEKITAPEALRLIAPRFFMRDANWFADYPTSAQKVSALYEKSGGATVDGVIAINSDLARDLLELTGPIEMPEYETTVGADNFYQTIQHEVEIDYDKEENRPKKILADLFPKLITNFSKLDREKWPQVLSMFFKAMENKDVMLYFTDEELEKLVLDFGWGGQLSQTDQDYLNVITTNIGGGKTDQVISQDTKLHIDIKDDGSVVNTLEIKRSHHGQASDFWEGVKNVSYLRVYVPLGSQLLAAEGYDDWFFGALLDPVEGSNLDPTLSAIEKSQEIHELSGTRINKESDKTVFGNWLGIEPGEEKTVKLKYKLPFKVKIDKDDVITSYSLVLQQQPGSEQRQFSSQIDYPEKWQPIWQHVIAGEITDDLQYQTTLDKDKVIGLIFSRKED